MATAPNLNIPPSNNTVEVFVIDSTARVRLPTSNFFEPEVAGYVTLIAVCYSFLVRHYNRSSQSKYDTFVFDLGVRKDFFNQPTVISDMLAPLPEGQITVEKDVATILEDEGVPLDSIGGIIWSHHHFDHTGNPTLFPGSVDLLVGPGFKDAFIPAFPTNANSSVDERLWVGRELVEIEISDELQIGQYDAYDFFGDGSFYLLSTPGHAIGHMSGLARTSSEPPEFMFLGGDIAHSGGEFRPTKYLPLPEMIDPNPLLPPYAAPQTPCPGALFEGIHPQHSYTEPFFRIATNGVHYDAAAAQHTVDKMQEFDAQNNVFVNVAHDRSLYDIVEFFPHVANGWSKKGWKEVSRWRFLRDIIGL